MSKNTPPNIESQLLGLLKRVLPQATHDAQLAGKIYDAVEQELKRKTRLAAFEKFCARVELPDLEAKSIAAVQQQLAESFAGADVTIKPNRKEQALAVEIALQDGTQWSGEVKVRPLDSSEAEDPEFTPKFVPFPVSLPGDKELVWALAKRETLTPEEAAIALTKVEEDFWGSKTGQKLLRDRVEKSFAEFISRVPSGMLGEAGLKRHYKTPEPVKVLQAGRRR
jgi:hypothetical protein